MYANVSLHYRVEFVYLPTGSRHAEFVSSRGDAEHLVREIRTMLPSSMQAELDCAISLTDDALHT